MALYVIGDVQGCYSALQRLLEKIRFEPTSDRLWFTGDLVNRGPNSVEVLRLVKSLGDRAITALGNHDLHLLAVAAGVHMLKSRDTLSDVLSAPDRNELLAWLARCPLLHNDDALNLTLVHAGLPPGWDAAEATLRAREAEAVISGPAASDFFHVMYGDEPRRWDTNLSRWERIRFIVNVYTRARFCTADGEMDYQQKGRPGSQPKELMPWFDVPQRRSRNRTIVFGHWSQLGLWQGAGVIGLDTGCVWGGQLTAARVDIEPLTFTSVSCR